MSGLLGILTGLCIIAVVFAFFLWNDKRKHDKSEERYWRQTIKDWNARPDTIIKLKEYEDWNK